MSRTRAEVIARILACRKLADKRTNSNEHERASAEAAAKRLMEQNGIKEEELVPAKSPKIEVTIVTYSDIGDMVAALLRKRGIKPKRGWEK